MHTGFIRKYWHPILIGLLVELRLSSRIFCTFHNSAPAAAAVTATHAVLESMVHFGLFGLTRVAAFSALSGASYWKLIRRLLGKCHV
jgi:hypothetical protein